jgi:hypothetical protein
MAIQTIGGKILLVGGKIATDPSCCCGGCSLCCGCSADKMQLIFTQFGVDSPFVAYEKEVYDTGCTYFYDTDAPTFSPISAIDMYKQDGKCYVVVYYAFPYPYGGNSWYPILNGVPVNPIGEGSSCPFSWSRLFRWFLNNGDPSNPANWGGSATWAFSLGCIS